MKNIFKNLLFVCLINYLFLNFGLLAMKTSERGTTLTSGIKYVPRGLLVFLDNSEHKGKSEHEGEIGDYHIAGPITCDLATALNQNAGPIIMQGNLVRLRG